MSATRSDGGGSAILGLRACERASLSALHYFRLSEDYLRVHDWSHNQIGFRVGLVARYANLTTV